MDGIPGELVSYGAMTIESGYGGGRPLPLTEARIRIGHHEQRQTINQTDKGITFFIDLPAGSTHLQTYFSGDDGMEVGAYYVYVEHIGE